MITLNKTKENVANSDGYLMIVDAVDNYYLYNPDTLMPLMMTALALKGNLKISIGETTSEITVCTLKPNEIKDYDWVRLDDSLKHQIDEWIKNGINNVSVNMEIGRSLLPIYKTIKNNDEKDVVQEYHHRIGRLIHHTSNELSERAQRQYATYILAKELINISKLSEKEHIKIFNHILEKSGLQPKRPRIRVALALKVLLNYDGKGLVYNPFTGCSIAGALLRSSNNYYGDGDLNEKVYAAGLLLNYGMGVSNEHFIQRDSKNWLIGKKIDYVISTYTGYINGESAFDFCLGKCLNDNNFSGRYAGAVLPREIFEKQTDNFIEALKRDWIETIVLLSFGEAVVLINAQKDKEQKGIIRFGNGTTPFTHNLPVSKLLKHNIYSKNIKTSDVLKNGYLRSLIVKESPEREGFEKVRLGEFVSRIPRAVYQLDNFDERERVLAYINRSEPYYGVRWKDNIERRTINHLFRPAYRLDKDCLIVNSTGEAEPRIFDAQIGAAFFEDGYAFAPNNEEDLDWLVEEINDYHSRRQLHPYGQNKMVPEPLTEDDYLNLIIYKPIPVDEKEGKDELTEEEKAKDALPAGFVIENDNKRYTILDYLSCGAFGYTYRAEMLNQQNGIKEIVAIKEFYPRLREQGIVSYRENPQSNRMKVDLEDPYLENLFKDMRKMFYNEGDFLRRMSDTPDNHVTEFKSLFDFEPTGTIYYSMKLYKGATLENMVSTDERPSESLIINNIVIPLCKALHTMEEHKILHLDIKPDNVVIDENGEAVLIDFGVAQQYDEEGNNTDVRGSLHQYGDWSAPENTRGNMKHFCPQSDIFSVAAILYTLLTNNLPTPISNEYIKFKIKNELNCSNQMKEAIIEGMAEYSNDRPVDAQRFLNLFPGCENIKL